MTKFGQLPMLVLVNTVGADTFLARLSELGLHHLFTLQVQNAHLAIRMANCRGHYCCHVNSPEIGHSYSHGCCAVNHAFGYLHGRRAGKSCI